MTRSMTSMVRRITRIYQIRMWLLTLLLSGTAMVAIFMFAVEFPWVAVGLAVTALVLLFRWENLL